MDIVKCAATSIVGIISLSRLANSHIEAYLTTFIFSFLVQYLGLKIYNILIWPFFISPLRALPGPKDGNLFLGQAYNLVTALPGELEKEWMRRSPEAPFIRYLSVGNLEFLIPTNARAIRGVLQTRCYSFIKPPYWWRVVGEIAGKGILFLEGEEHKKQRRLLVGPFSFGNIKNLLPWFDSKAKELATEISKRLANNPAEPIEVSSLLSHTTLDVVGLAVLGFQLKSLSSSSPLADSYQKIFEVITPLQIIITVIHQFVPIRHWIPLETNRAYVRANAEVRKVLREHIRRRRLEFREGLFANEKGSRDLLKLMIEESKDSYTEDEMLGYLLNFMSAGHETTSGALTWALYSLTLYPHMQTRLRREISAQLLSESPTYAELESLNFLNNFTKEVLRYYPPAPTYARQAAESVEIDGVLIPKGTLIMIVPGVQHFNPLIWGPTVNEFDPDRFDNLPKEAQDPYASESFSSGPRVCVGKSFALLEFKTIMVELVKRFDIANTGKVEPQRGGVSLRPLDGLKLRMTEVQSQK